MDVEGGSKYYLQEPTLHVNQKFKYNKIIGTEIWVTSGWELLYLCTRERGFSPSMDYY